MSAACIYCPFIWALWRILTSLLYYSVSILCHFNEVRHLLIYHKTFQLLIFLFPSNLQLFFNLNLQTILWFPEILKKETICEIIQSMFLFSWLTVWSFKAWLRLNTGGRVSFLYIIWSENPSVSLFFSRPIREYKV